MWAVHLFARGLKLLEVRHDYDFGSEPREAIHGGVGGRTLGLVGNLCSGLQAFLIDSYHDRDLLTGFVVYPTQDPNPVECPVGKTAGSLCKGFLGGPSNILGPA